MRTVSLMAKLTGKYESETIFHHLTIVRFDRSKYQNEPSRLVPDTREQDLYSAERIVSEKKQVSGFGNMRLQINFCHTLHCDVTDHWYPAAPQLSTSVHWTAKPRPMNHGNRA